MACCLLHSKFEVIRPLGEGSFGSVLLCKKWEGEEDQKEEKEKETEKKEEKEEEQEEQNVDKRKQFAIKIITKVLENENKEEREVDALYRLAGHDNIVKYYESWSATRPLTCRIEDGLEEENGMEELKLEELFIVMEFCPQTLSNLLGSFQNREAWLYFTQLITALDHIHSHGFIHRDISKNNIFFRDNGCLVVADFGCAVEMVDVDPYPMDGYAVILGSPYIGTAPYAAPELRLVAYPVGCKADMFSAGVLLIQMLGRIEADTVHQEAAIIDGIKRGVFPDGFSAMEIAFITDLLSSEPRDRPSAKDILEGDELQALIDSAAG